MSGYNFTYKRLGQFGYTLLPPEEIKTFLLEWLIPEWEEDHKESPNQLWTAEWLEVLPNMEFSLEVVRLRDINLRQDLMSYKVENYSFLHELRLRADEREISLLRGVTAEPLVVNASGNELMDGYTRHMVFERYQQHEVFAYVGHMLSAKHA